MYIKKKTIFINYFILIRFRNVNCQAPGSCHDAAVFKNSTLYKEAERIIPKVYFLK